MSITHHQRATRPLGAITRGTTGVGRLRRVDTWLAARFAPKLLTTSSPVVVDLGFGAEPTTTIELQRRLRALRPDLQVVGIEIDPERVHHAESTCRALGVEGVSFRRGGFELGGLAAEGANVVVVRAFNVLRQYDEAQVEGAWSTMRRSLAWGGVIVEGTCDEAGRRLTWITLDAHGPRTLTLAADFDAIEQPSDLAERLPKALIHRNVPGEPIHALFADWDREWRRAAPLSVFGARGRWVRSVEGLRGRGWPVMDGPAAWGRGAVTLRWSAVAPGGAGAGCT